MVVWTTLGLEWGEMAKWLSRQFPSMILPRWPVFYWPSSVLHGSVRFADPSPSHTSSWTLLEWVEYFYIFQIVLSSMIVKWPNGVWWEMISWGWWWIVRIIMGYCEGGKCMVHQHSDHPFLFFNSWWIAMYAMTNVITVDINDPAHKYTSNIAYFAYCGFTQRLIVSACDLRAVLLWDMMELKDLHSKGDVYPSEWCASVILLVENTIFMWCWYPWVIGNWWKYW